MNYEEFFERVRDRGVNFDFDNEKPSQGCLLSNEALFHLPLLALTILLLSKGRRKPKSQQIGQLVGECLEKSLLGFKGSAQHVGWSANLRVRTVKALNFLEVSSLVKVDQNKGVISSTDLGKKVINALFEQDTDLSYTMRVINQNYRNIYVEKQIEMELI